MKISIKYFTISCMISLLVGFCGGILICAGIIKDKIDQIEKLK